MNNSKLIEVIRQLSAAESRKLSDQLQTKGLNSRPEVYRLFVYILKNLGGNRIALRKERVFAHLFPKQTYDAKKVRYTMHYLYQHIEKFLAAQSLQNQPLTYRRQLLRQFRQRNCPKASKSSLRKLQQHMEVLEGESAYQYRQRFLVELEKYEQSMSKQRRAPKNLQALNDSLDLSYLAEKLKNCCLALSHQAVVKVSYDTGLLPFVLNYLQDNPLLQQHPLIGLYYHYFMAETTEISKPHFSALRRLMDTPPSTIENSEWRTIYLLAINYGIKQYNRGEAAYLREVFDLYREALEKDLLLENQQLSPFAYKNIAGIAIRLAEYEWAADFITSYAPLLPASQQEDYYHFLKAKWHYSNQQFDASMRHLATVQFTDLFLNLDAKVLLMKIYFEQAEFDALESLLSSTQRFLQRQKMMSYHKQNYLNTLLYTRKLIETNLFDARKKQQLIEKIQRSSPIGEKSWLLQMLAK